MPRCARIKTRNSIFHIIVRSISEIDLFRDNDDKEAYLNKIREYQMLFGFKVYAYCLMSNHAHIIIDSNGGDISKIMHGINLSYAQRYNHKYKRHGHLFQDRFKSKTVFDNRYLLVLTAYIHNNAKAIKGFEKTPEKYEFSSLRLFLGYKKSMNSIVDKNFIKFVMGPALGDYKILLNRMKLNKFEKDMELEGEKSLYISCKQVFAKNIDSDTIIRYICENMGIDSVKLHLKYVRQIKDIKGLIVVLMRSICNYKCKEICAILGNITQSRVSKLSSIGIKLIMEDEFYKKIATNFMERYAC